MADGSDRFDDLEEKMEHLARGFPNNDPVQHRLDHELIMETMQEIRDIFQSVKAGLRVLEWLGWTAKVVLPVIALIGGAMAYLKDHWK